jgi:TRAP-type mannitol/chloroaromatic compound transport system substrate-binding protein
MKRRRLLTLASPNTLTVAEVEVFRHTSARATSTPSDRPSRPAVNWRMATSWPKSADVVFGAIATICERVSTATGGRFIIIPYGVDEIVPADGILDAVSEGTVECGHTSSHYYLDRNPSLAFAASIPFGLNSQQQNAWLYKGGGLEAIRNLYADFNIINFPAGNTGTQMGGWFRRKIDAVADLKGLKMRIPGLGGRVMSKLGVDVRDIPAHKIVPALIDGEIEATEWIGPYDDEQMGLHRAAPFYYYPGWWSPSETLDLLIHRSAWDALPPEYREILRTAAMSANLKMVARYQVANGDALQRFIVGGTQLLPYGDAILKAARDAAFELYEETAAGDTQFRQIYEPWKVFRTRVYRWNRVNELGFAQFALNLTD